MGFRSDVVIRAERALPSRLRLCGDEPQQPGQTAGRILVHVETERASEKLVNQRLAYVAVSRGQYDVRIYTDDKAKLARVLDRDVSHRSPLESTRRARISPDRES